MRRRPYDSPLRRGLAPLLSALVCTAPAPVLAAAPRLPLLAPAEAPPRAGLEVDTSALGDEGPGLAQRITERCKSALLEAEVLPARGEEDPTIVVTVAASGTEDEPAFSIELRLLQGERPVAGAQRFACALCTEGEVVEAIGEHLPQAIDRIRELGAAGDDGSAGPAPAAEEGPRPAGTPDERPSRGLTALGGVGIGVAVLGLAGVGAGAGLVAVDGDFVAGDASGAPQVKATRGAGLALVGAGAAATVVGVVLLAVDLHRARQGRVKPTSFTPVAGPHGAGLAVHGRF